jgi:uncharacterized protein with PQ loop repeat
MHMSYQILAVGLVGGALALGRSLPQMVRIMRQGHARGVAIPTLWTGTVAGASWATYGLLADQPAVALASAAAAAAYAATLVMARRRVRQGSGVMPGFWAACLVLVLWWAGTAAFGLALAASALLTGLPQLRLVTASGELSGVSHLAWLTCFAEGSLWLAIGLHTDDVAVIIWSVGQIAVSGAIVRGLRIADTGQRERCATGT